MKKNSKRHQKNKKNVLNKEAYSLSDAVKAIKGITKAKFDEIGNLFSFTLIQYNSSGLLI